MPHPIFCYFVVEKSKIRYKYWWVDYLERVLN